MRTALAFALLVTAATVTPGCGHHFSMTAPDDFVVLDEDSSSFDMRATSADGVVIAVREIDNDPPGTLNFWVDAIRNRMRMNGGYALLEEKDVTAASGQRGKQLRFGRDQNGVAFRYWLTIFVGDSRLHLVEAGGREEIFAPAEERVDRANASIRID